MMKKTWMIAGLMLLLGHLSVQAEAIKSGPWKFILKTNHAEVPFIAEFKFNKKGEIIGKIFNGAETIPLRGIYQKGKDIVIPISAYQISLEMTIQEKNALTGYLVRHNKNPISKTPIVAIAGLTDRFRAPETKAVINLTGKWTFIAEDDQGQKSPAIGNFVQKGNEFSGSILTPTGDYRYLSGVINDQAFEAASFDGVYNYVFRGAVKDGRMDAAILSNTKTKLTGHLDPKAALPDAYKQTEIPDLKFIFPDLKGQNVSLTHPKFKNKPVIVQIYGSWCPNCLDEMKYLIPWYNKNKNRGIEIVALAFERSLSVEDATKQLIKVQKKFKVPYVILQAGSTSEDKPMEKISGIKNFISFPTTIFLNRKHQVVKVHAGFSGPSTGEYFEIWKKEFNQTVNGLLKK